MPTLKLYSGRLIEPSVGSLGRWGMGRWRLAILLFSPNFISQSPDFPSWEQGCFKVSQVKDGRENGRLGDRKIRKFTTYLPIVELISVPFALTKMVKSQLLIINSKLPSPCLRVSVLTCLSRMKQSSWEGLGVG